MFIGSNSISMCFIPTRSSLYILPRYSLWVPSYVWVYWAPTKLFYCFFNNKVSEIFRKLGLIRPTIYRKMPLFRKLSQNLLFLASKWFQIVIFWIISIMFTCINPVRLFFIDNFLRKFWNPIPQKLNFECLLICNFFEKHLHFHFSFIIWLSKFPKNSRYR